MNGNSSRHAGATEEVPSCSSRSLGSCPIDALELAYVSKALSSTGFRLEGVIAWE